MRKNMEALSKYHYQKNKRNVGPKERGKTDGPTHGDVLYTPRVARQASKRERNGELHCHGLTPRKG